MKIPVLLLLAWTARQSEAREVFQIAPLGRIPETWNYSAVVVLGIKNILNGAPFDKLMALRKLEAQRLNGLNVLNGLSISLAVERLERFERSAALERLELFSYFRLLPPASRLLLL